MIIVDRSLLKALDTGAVPLEMYRLQLAFSWNGRGQCACQFCGVPLKSTNEKRLGSLDWPQTAETYHLEHAVPDSYRFPWVDDWFNLNASCEPCNLRKHADDHFFCKLMRWVMGGEVAGDFPSVVERFMNRFARRQHTVEANSAKRQITRMWSDEMLPLWLRHRTFPHWPALLSYGINWQDARIDRTEFLTTLQAWKTRALVHFLCRYDVPDLVQTYEIIFGCSPAAFYVREKSRLDDMDL